MAELRIKLQLIKILSKQSMIE